MKNATRTLALVFAVAAGLASIEHGVLEALQGNTTLEGVMIASAGPPCVPEEVWNNCEPAMTIIPNFLITGILATLIGLIVLVWAATMLERRRGALGLIVLSILMLLFGGGIFPPIIGLVAGLTATMIGSPLKWWRANVAPPVSRLLAGWWPWTLIIFVGWILAQWVVGYFFNDFLLEHGYWGLALILVLLPLSPLSAIAHDSQAKPVARPVRRAA